MIEKQYFLFLSDSYTESPKKRNPLAVRINTMVPKSFQKSFLFCQIPESLRLAIGTGLLRVLENLESYSGIFQNWKVLEKGYWSLKVLEIC